jgi:hypothetical protein
MVRQFKQDIIEAQHQVREVELRVAQQEVIIALLNRERRDTTEAHRLLVILKNTLALERRRLQKMLGGRSY